MRGITPAQLVAAVEWAIASCLRRALLKIRHVPEQLDDVTGIPLLSTLMFTL